MSHTYIHTSHFVKANMKLLSATAALLCLAPAADAFVVAPPSLRTGVASTRQQSATTATTMVAAPSSAAAAVTSVLQSSVVPLIAAAGGVADPGTVDAPAWVLPVGAFTVILTAGLIPLLLKVRRWGRVYICTKVCFVIDTADKKNNPLLLLCARMCACKSSQSVLLLPSVPQYT